MAGIFTPLENLKDGAARFGLNSRKADKILLEMAEQVLSWEKMFADYGIAREDIDLFRSSFESVLLREALELETTADRH